MATPSGYTVKSGDTLSQIGSKYGLNYNNIAKWNNISNPNKIGVGQYLRFSAPTKSTPAPAAASKPVGSSFNVGNNKNLGQVVKGANNSYNQAMKDYQNSKEMKNANQMMNSTIDDIAKKYGFDYSRDYAKQQAEALAQAERNAYEHSQRLNKSQNQLNTQRIDNDVRSANQDIDNSFFQQYLQQQQEQVNGGLNAGIAADQDFRLGMSQQQAMADIYRDANMNRQEEQMRYGNEQLRLSEALDLVEQQRIAKENELYQQQRQQGFENLLQERSQGMQMSQNEWNKAQDKIANMLNISKMDAERIIKEAEYSGRYDGVKTAEQLAREFQQQMQEREMKLKQDQFAYQKQIDAQKLALQRQEIAAANARAAAARAAASRPSASSSSSPVSNAVKSYNAAKSKAGSTFSDKYYADREAKYNNIYNSQPKVYKPGKTYLDRNPVINNMVKDRVFARPNLSMPRF